MCFVYHENIYGTLSDLCLYWFKQRPMDHIAHLNHLDPYLKIFSTYNSYVKF